MALLEGKVAIVTGAGRGIGREEALLLAKHGAKVVVNDLGGHFDGTGESRSPAEEVVKQIRASGGEAVANFESVSDFKAAKRIFECALDNFGKLNVVVNNAGILRDRMIFNMSEEDFDAVIAVHLKGSFNMARHACAYWREQHKLGNVLGGRLINTSSDSGLIGNIGQTNYGAAKAGLAAMAMIVDMEMNRYGVTANAIAPLARTRMTTDAVAGAPGRTQEQALKPGEFDPRDPANVAPVVVWLASDDAKDVHGEVFRTGFGAVWLMKGWHAAACFTTNEPWDPASLGAKLKGALAQGLSKKETMADVRASSGH